MAKVSTIPMVSIKECINIIKLVGANLTPMIMSEPGVGKSSILEALRVDDASSNPKGRLQEILQSLAPRSPQYEVVDQFGPEHAKMFTSRILWEGQELGRGTGRSKKEAEAAAATEALNLRSWEHSGPAGNL